jgi:hypothetical protein
MTKGLAKSIHIHQIVDFLVKGTVAKNGLSIKCGDPIAGRGEMAL